MEATTSIDSLFGVGEVREAEEKILRFLGMQSGEELNWPLRWFWTGFQEWHAVKDRTL